MTDAAVKVDPDFYNRRLLDTEANQSQRSFSSTAGTSSRGGVAGSGSSVGGAGMRGSGPGSGLLGGFQDAIPDLPDYLMRQHSLLGLYLSLNPPDEMDAEARWGFSQPKRMAIAGVTVVVPLFLALFVSGSWFWKACFIGAVTVGAMWVMRLALRTASELEMTVQGYTLVVWPHLVLSSLGVLAGIWLISAIASGTGWSTVWLCLTSVLLLISAEAALRAGMWYFRWWAPAERFAFLQPWRDDVPRHGGGFHSRENSYAPPGPVAVPPPEPVNGAGGGVSNGGVINGEVSDNGLGLDEEAANLLDGGKSLGSEGDISESV